MKLLPLGLAATALLASCAAPTVEQAPVAGAPPPLPAPAPPPPPPPPHSGVVAHAGDPCPLTVVFGSYAMGIDSGARGRIEALLAGDRAVAGFTAQPWGREGEVTLCARTRTPADAARLFQEIRALVPPRPRGPVTIRTQSGLRFETAPR